MSFTKGFWVTIIILTLNRQQGTQRTAWAGSRAERGDKPPPADASPSRSSPTCHCHSDPDSHIKPSRKTPGPFGQPNTKTLPEAATKHTPAFECREAARDAGREALQSADSTAFIHPQPQPPRAPTITVQSQAPKEAEIENTFSLKHSLNFMNSITLDFLSISWSEYCKTREKGGGGPYERQQVQHPSAHARPRRGHKGTRKQGSELEKGLFPSWRKLSIH